MAQHTECDYCGARAPASLYYGGSGWRVIGISGSDRRGTYTHMHFCLKCKRRVGVPTKTFLRGMGRKDK